MKKFIEKSETLYYSCINEAETNELYEHLLIKVNSETRDVIVNVEDQSWESIKKVLMKYYDYLCNKNLVTTQLENLKQKRDESLTDYAERARKLLRTKNAMYNHLSEEQKSEYNRLASKAFTRGIIGTNLRERVATRGAYTLESAIENAIDMETDVSNQIAQNELYCRWCRIIGHRERDCRRRNGGDNAITKLVSALRNIGNVNFAGNNRNPNQMNRFRTNYRNQNNFRNDSFNPRNNSNYSYGYNNTGFSPRYSNPYNSNTNLGGVQPRYIDRTRNFSREQESFPRNIAQNSENRETMNRNNYRRNANGSSSSVNRMNQVGFIGAPAQKIKPDNSQEN